MWKVDISNNRPLCETVYSFIFIFWKLWACGVVLYIMLCGRFPFWGKTDIEYMKRLSHGPSMVGDGWSEVSNAGKEFLKQLLQLDPSRRLTAEDALNHPWILGDQGPGDGTMQKRLSSVNELAALMSKQKSLKKPKETEESQDNRSDPPAEEQKANSGTEPVDIMSTTSTGGKVKGVEETSPFCDENANVNTA